MVIHDKCQESCISVKREELMKSVECVGFSGTKAAVLIKQVVIRLKTNQSRIN